MPNAYDFAYEDLFAGDTDALHVYLEQVYTLRQCTSVDETTLKICYDLGLSTGAAMSLHIWNSASPLSTLSVNCNRKTPPERLAESSVNVFWHDFPKVAETSFGEQPAQRAFIRGWFDGYNGTPAPQKMAEHLARLRREAEKHARRRKTREKARSPHQIMHTLIDQMSEDQVQQILADLELGGD